MADSVGSWAGQQAQLLHRVASCGALALLGMSGSITELMSSRLPYTPP